VEGWIATGRGGIVIPPRPQIGRIGSVLFAGFLLLAASDRLQAQVDDPSEIFLKAYMNGQQGEKLEQENQFRAALAKYRFAGSLIEELRKNHADWQPAIVDYRGRKISEGILRVQDKVGTQNDLAATAPSSESLEAVGQSTLPEPKIETTSPQTPTGPSQVGEAASSTPPPSDAAIKAATQQLNARLEQLQTELDNSRSQLGAAQKEKEALNGRLQETTSKLETAQGELEKTKGAEQQVRDQLAKAQESLKKVQSAGDTNTKSQLALRAEITRLKDALIAAEGVRAAAEKEKDASNARMAEANKRLAAVTQERDSATNERDSALAQLKGMKEAQKRMEVLVAENASLQKKLADAEKTVQGLSDEKPKKEQQLADVRRQIDELQKQLAASQKRNRDYDTQVADLRSQLDIAAAQLEKAKLVGATAEESTRLRKENDMLRNIVMRERQEEARRDQAKKLMLAEFDKLKINSDTLNQQIELLAQPVTKLSDEELALLRQPVVSLSDNNPATIKASFAFAKKTTATSVRMTSHRDDDSEAENDVSTSPSGNVADSGFKPDVPGDLRPAAFAAKEAFEHGKYRTAEKQYQEILIKAPNNLYSLSNLGVVYFRTGRFKAAELTLKKAVTISPRDEFALTTLGIVYYRQAKFDSALTELTRALAINPKSATAHNYLGITASQKGWQEAAEKELIEALNTNPNYADAHFNLAVIYATAQPPARELARQHYTKATALGAEPDASLEKLLR
jgi:Flp pilus assembly protein TadD/predicted  nucleic acid-binding Zn-ribbon protein